MLLELTLCLSFALPPECFALPSEKVCEANYKKAEAIWCEWNRLYEVAGSFALQQRVQEAAVLKRYWWAAWWVTWKPATLAERRSWAVGLRRLTSPDGE